MNFTGYLRKIQHGEKRNRNEAEAFLSLMLDDDSITDKQLAEALTALADHQPSIDEVCGFISAMRARMNSVKAPIDSIDTCGTGGDKSGTFNISTAAALLVSAGTVTVAKHGNRAATSKCGSADVLEALHVPVDLDARSARKSLLENQFAFLFAPYYHPSLKRLAIIRKQLGFPTVFNLLGPLLNPAGVKRQVIGTFSIANAELLSAVILRMEYQHAIVLTSEDGLDEAGLNTPVRIYEVQGKKLVKYSIQAKDFGFKPASWSSLKGGDPENNADIVTDALKPSETFSAAQNVIVLNSGLCFYIAGKDPTIAAGVNRAKSILASGRAASQLHKLRTAQ